MSFVTLEELKDELGVADATQDTRLQRSVDAANGLLLRIFRLDQCEPKTYTHDLDVFDVTDEIIIPSYPVVRIETVSDLTTSAASVIPSADYYVRNLYRLVLTGRGTYTLWPCGRRTIQCAYVAGFITVDPTLKIAALIIAMNQRGTIAALKALSSDGVVKREKHWHYEIEFFNSASTSPTTGGAIPDEAQDILNSWIRIEPSSNG